MKNSNNYSATPEPKPDIKPVGTGSKYCVNAVHSFTIPFAKEGFYKTKCNNCDYIIDYKIC